jgi:hypothetical protein
MYRKCVGTVVAELAYTHECGHTTTVEVRGATGTRIDCDCGAVLLVTVSEISAPDGELGS